MVMQKHYTNTSTLVDYLSHYAARLSDIHTILLKIKKNNKDRSPDLLRRIDATEKQLGEMGRALIMEYRQHQENERFLKQILVSISDQLFLLNNDFKETGHLLLQEIRTLQFQTQCSCKGEEKQHFLYDQKSSCSQSKIDEIIKRLQKAREQLSVENPHLFEKEIKVKIKNKILY
ncbi:hypothetical protein ACMY46_04455 [Bartonella bacilliformis]|uniref:hypothetical protein n=1 Tax=Bartonella bacilliformis TaxID=774 RepID=UPI00049F9553|nr:hypothetical protein [Bartonella bacilliformis]KEG16728.1 hypothetical protein H705_00606 [Bartonella bacilliformis Cond044]